MKTIWLTLVLVTIMFSELSAQKILVYNGPGASKGSTRQTIHTLKLVTQEAYQIEAIGPEQVLNEEWEKETALFVIPGGADIPYCQFLNGAANQKIASFVANGGAFLGICAGSYYAGNFVEFAKETEQEVVGVRELSFFPGTVSGPLFGPFDYDSNSSTRLDILSWQHDKTIICPLVYQGGGYFVAAVRVPATTVLATYSLGNDFAAIIECRYGHGRAILSGPHFEYDPALLDREDPYLAPIIYELTQTNDTRLMLASYLLERLGLKTAVVTGDSSLR